MLEQNTLKKLTRISLAMLLSLTMLTSCKNDNVSQVEDTKSAVENNLSSVVKQQSTSENKMRKVTDMKGNEVEIPQNVEKIADLWHANNQVVMLLGGADKLVATTDVIQKNDWITTIKPQLKDIKAPVSGQDLNIEELLDTKPDVALTSNEQMLESANSAGIPAVYVSFQNFDDLKKCVETTAEVIGDDAKKIAKEYNEELDENIKFVEDRLKDVKEDQKPKVLHIAGGDDLTKIDGEDSLIGEWMKISGATNSIKDAKNLENITIEEIISSNPDIIIIGGSNAKEGIESIKNDPAWKDVEAVKNGKVIQNPVGTFNWDRYSAEEA
ncbi:MAG: ABC transporter substrate-binding protein, partial [Tissierellia bacterium]|nr:ABC transporter substrate-binding protein [Tissierellia bacterium]